MTILKPSYVLGRVRNIIENPIRIILTLILDSLSSTNPNNLDNERIITAKIPITSTHDMPIPRLMMETASYLATIPSMSLI